jgi:hypothetical protein
MMLRECLATSKHSVSLCMKLAASDLRRSPSYIWGRTASVLLRRKRQSACPDEHVNEIEIETTKHTRTGNQSEIACRARHMSGAAGMPIRVLKSDGHQIRETRKAQTSASLHAAAAPIDSPGPAQQAMTGCRAELWLPITSHTPDQPNTKKNTTCTKVQRSATIAILPSTASAEVNHYKPSASM